MTEQSATAPKLSPLYKPAEDDSAIVIHFIGNTADVGGIQLHKITPFQLKAAAWFLERHAEKMMNDAERIEREMGPAQVSGDRSIITPGMLRGGG